MASTTGRGLLQQAEKILLSAIHPQLLACCPTMDLIAAVTDEENLDVYRMNGQRAFGLKRKSSNVTVDCICWQFNGQAIAVSWSDGLTDIVSSETGKVIHPNIPASSDVSRKPRIRKMGWGLNFIDADAVKRRTGEHEQKTNGFDFKAETTDAWDASTDDTTIEDFLQRQPDLQALNVNPDLPDQLAMMDLETLLPKLPPIPLPPALPFMRPQADNGAFSSQAQVDSLLHSHQQKDHNSVDMFIRCTDDGTVHPSIYDSLETVDIRLPSAWNVDRSRPVLHTNHPYSCSHGLLTEMEAGGQSKLAFVPLTLGFIPSAGRYLHLIAAKTAQLQNLLLYIYQCLQRIRAYFKHSQDLPRKFMMNITETLAEKGQGTLVQNLYHLACTGHCPELLREWLVDELAETGHKRWDNTVVTSLTMVIQLIHENLLPAIDRCSIVISRLRGLAKYHEAGWIFDTPINDFSALLEQLKNMRLLAHTALTNATDEKRHFLSFSKWLRFEIDFEATEPGSQSRTELEGRDSGVDVNVVLDYIQYNLTQSDMAAFFIENDSLPAAQKEAPASTYPETVDAFRLAREDAAYKPQVLCLEHVLHHFRDGCTKLFQQISHWQERSIQMDCGMVLEENVSLEGSEALDMRMLHQPTPTSPSAITTYVLFAPLKSSDLHIHRLSHTPAIHALPSSLYTYAISTLHFPTATVLSAAFADDKILLLLLQRHDEPKTCVLLFVPYTRDAATNASLTGTTQASTATKATERASIMYKPLPPSLPKTTVLPTGQCIGAEDRKTITFSDADVEAYTQHEFEPRFTPLKLVVNGRKGRRVIVVLGSDRKHFRILDLDYGQRSGGEEEKEKEKEEGDNKADETVDRDDRDVEMSDV